jgi:hypothetical protein
MCVNPDHLQVVETIFDKIGRTNKFYVEFGFGYGYISNDEASFRVNKPNVGYMRFKGGWSGVLFDPDLESSFWNSKILFFQFASFFQV